MSEWQPIETSPKDGEHFLAYRPDRCCEVWWTAIDTIDGNTVLELGGHGFTLPDFAMPTHWMPLPPPPVISNG